MGADNSDLVITDGTRIWQRNLPIGGNHFTRALTKELKLTFAKAEHLKRNATKAQDPRAIFQAMRPVFNDLVSEIQRSIGYFSSVHRQSKITRIIGMGNAFKLPGLQKFLAQNLQYEVEKVESFKCVKGDPVLSAPAFQENILSFAVVYGLALQGLAVAGVRTSLLPPEISQARMIRRKKPWALTAAAVLMAGFTFLFFGNWAQLNAVSSSDFDVPLDKAKTATKLKDDKKAEYEKAKNEWNGVKKNGEDLTANVDKRLEWIEVLGVINTALPNNPANVDRKNLTELGEVQITSITATWYDEVKSGWFDKKTADPKDWPATTVHPLDKSKPPSGGGWVFTLDGYHFNKGLRQYTMAALLDTRNGFQSAAVREFGIQGAIVIDTVSNSNWTPSEATSSSPRSRSTRTGGSGGASRGGGGGANSGMLSGGLGGGDDGGSGGAASDNSDGGSGGARGGMRGGVQEGGDAPAGGAPNKRTGGIAPPAVVPKTDFVLEFVWNPTESKRKPSSAWLVEMNEAVKEAVKQGRSLTRKIPEAKSQDAPGTTPQAAPGATGLNPSNSPGQPQGNQQPGVPATAPPGSGPIPGNPASGGSPTNGAVPGNPPGTGQGVQPGQGPTTNN
jgi:type IV pilus assembly protein PilM